MSKELKEQTITLVIEEGEVIQWQANGKGSMMNMTIAPSLAYRIWKEVASIMGRQAALKVPKKKRHEYAMMGAKAAKNIKR